MSSDERNVLILFDIDGTLSASRATAKPEMMARIEELRETHWIGVVGGSDVDKGMEQLGADLFDKVDYYFPQNGLCAFKGREKIHEQSIKAHLGEKNIARFVNWTLRYLSELDLPVKRGTFVEFRSGMFNVSPIGRNCSQEERMAFNEYDNEHGVRLRLVEAMKAEFADLKLRFVIGGQISIDVFPEGWDKTYCLRHVEHLNCKEIHFFGDKTAPGGNDHEIFASERTVGHTVTDPEHTMQLLNELFPSGK
jgi:phosphomannomutase